MENLAVKELERGREYASELQRWILKSDNGEDDEDEALTTSYAQDLAVKVEDSLRNAILLLNFDGSHQICENRSQTIKDPRRFSPDKRKSIQTWEEYSKIPKEDGYAWRKYGEKIILNAKYPRKSVQTWEEYTKIPKEDGYAWRKYGEKIILNAKYPRCYFRCTHKFDQGCEATKQVQVGVE